MANREASEKKLGTAREVAEFLNISEASLAQHRYRGTGPRFIKLAGRRVLYRWSEVERYLDSNTLLRSDRSRVADGVSRD